MSDAPLGRIVWHELVTADAAVAEEFYTALLDWKLVSENGRRWLADEHGPVAGLCQLPRGDADGMENRWLLYVRVADGEEELRRRVDGAVKAGWQPMGEHHAERGENGSFALRLVGRRGHAPTVPLAHDNVSAPLTDEQGPPVGRFCWNQMTIGEDRLDAVSADFAALYGWRLRRNGGRGGTFESDGTAVAGWHLRSAGSEAPDHWLPFVHVADVKAAVGRVEALAGRVVVPPSEHPQQPGELYAVVADPSGGVVALTGWAG